MLRCFAQYLKNDGFEPITSIRRRLPQERLAALPQDRFEPILLTFCFAANVGFLGKVKEISAIYTSWAPHRLIFRKASA
jgi:hypothetical protein